MPQPRVAVDAMGGDHGAAVVAQGAVLACRELGVGVSLVGSEAVLRSEIRALDSSGLPIEIVDAPDVVVNVIDASNLERNLYLTTQLLEMNVPVVVALNMMDLARQRGIRIEVDHLAKHLGCPVIPVVASKKKGTAQLRAAIEEVSATKHVPGIRIAYEKDIEKVLQSLEISLSDVALSKQVSARWLAVKLLEKDELACALER